jgi:hypothetical protein
MDKAVMLQIRPRKSELQNGSNGYVPTESHPVSQKFETGFVQLRIPYPGGSIVHPGSQNRKTGQMHTAPPVRQKHNETGTG